MDNTPFIAHTRMGFSDKLLLIGLPVMLWLQTAYFLYWLEPLGIAPSVDYTEPLWNAVTILLVLGITAAFLWALLRNGSQRLRLDTQGLHWSPPIGKKRNYRWDEIESISLTPRHFGAGLAEMAQGEETPRPTYSVLLKKPLTGWYTSLSRRTSRGDFFINGVKSDRSEAELLAAFRRFAGDKFKG